MSMRDPELSIRRDGEPPRIQREPPATWSERYPGYEAVARVLALLIAVAFVLAGVTVGVHAAVRLVLLVWGLT